MIPLVDVGIREIDDDRTKQFCLELFPLTGDKVKASKPAPGEIGKWIDGLFSESFNRTNISTCEFFQVIIQCIVCQHRRKTIVKTGFAHYVLQVKINYQNKDFLSRVYMCVRVFCVDSQT